MRHFLMIDKFLDGHYVLQNKSTQDSASAQPATKENEQASKSCMACLPAVREVNYMELSNVAAVLF